jgi:hypothetical protein
MSRTLAGSTQLRRGGFGRGHPGRPAGAAWVEELHAALPAIFALSTAERRIDLAALDLAGKTADLQSHHMA